MTPITITSIEIEAPEGPWPVWPDGEWVDAIVGSKMGPPDRVRLDWDHGDKLCLIFSFCGLLADVVLSIEPKRRRGAVVAKRAAPFCWSPAEIRTLLDELHEGRGWVTWDEAMASAVAPELRP